MKALLLNTLLGIILGRYFRVWAIFLFVPIIAAELAYGIVMHDLWNHKAALFRRGMVLLLTAELACVMGMLLRPTPEEIDKETTN